MCLEGASRAGAALLQTIADERLRAYYVWLPMLPPDDVRAAEQAAARFAEPRARHYWDAGRQLSERLGAALGVDPAWDLYLTYAPGRADIASPRFWMHQLPIEQGTRLDGDLWRRRIGELLRGESC